MPAAAIKIDIVSDVVCPWCIIGYKQLQKALSELDGEVEAEIQWHPFELNPQMAAEGQDIGEHMKQKYGASPDQSRGNRQRLKDMGERLGFPFSYGEGMRIYNTFAAHQLLDWVGETAGADAQTALQLALFQAYFQQGLDVSDEEVLIAKAEEAGLDGEAARAILNDPEHAARTRAKLNFWVEQGVSGVPATILDGKFMVPGAQEADTFVNIIRKVVEKRAA